MSIIANLLCILLILSNSPKHFNVEISTVSMGNQLKSVLYYLNYQEK